MRAGITPWELNLIRYIRSLMPAAVDQRAREDLITAKLETLREDHRAERIAGT